MSFYRGYIEVCNKIPRSKYANVPDDQLLTLEQAKQCPEYSGVLSTNAVCLDWDKQEDAEIALKIIKSEGLKCRVIKSTRGIHALFLNDGDWKSTFTDKQLCCGLRADCKLGLKNGLEYLKDKNGEREVLYDTKDYETPPFYFKPAKVKEPVDFVNMGSGDGRNSAFYSWILTLNKSMNKDDARTTLDIINTYVVKEPLPADELATISRDEAFPEQDSGAGFFDDGRFNFSDFARALLNTHKIIRINGNLHIYKDGVYVQGKEEIERVMIEELPILTQAKRNEVFSYLHLIAENVDDVSKYCIYIAFRNGIYNILTKQFEDFNPDYIVTNKIDYDYNPNAYCEVADKVLNRMACDDSEIRALMEEMIGSCLYRSNKLGGGKAFILTGNKSNGKSTFLDMIKNLMGKKNYCALDLNELNERFKKAVPFGKLVNIGDDIGDKYIDDSSIFKKMVTGEDISAEYKGDPRMFSYTATCKMMFASNNLPKVRDKTGAIKRRLIIIPFNANFKPTDADFNPMIGFRLMQDDVMEYLIKIGIDGLMRVINNNGYTNSNKTKIALDIYDKDNNPILYFFEDLEFDLDIDCQPTSEVYDKYRAFCLENNLQPMSNIEFTKCINREYGTTVVRKRVDGKVRRIFMK